MKSTLKNLIAILSTGYIFLYFSEHLFWARVRPDDSLLNWLTTWLAYSLSAYVFLRLVSYFRVRNIWALFLAGAVFGWLTEGVIVQTTYESLPLSISFTGLAWHALITVWLGWYALRKALLSSSMRTTVKLAALIGLGYGLWAINWWLEPDGGVATLREFAMYSFTITTLVILAYRLANWSLFTPIRWNKWITVAVASLFGFAFVFGAIPAVPISVLILPLLLGLCYWGLRLNRTSEPEESLLDSLTGPIPIRNLLALFVLPLTSTLVYALALSFNLKLQTNWLVYIITTPLGFFLFGYSLFKIWRRSKLNQPAA
jgi:hypothetical protein